MDVTRLKIKGKAGTMMEARLLPGTLTLTLTPTPTLIGTMMEARLLPGTSHQTALKAMMAPLTLTIFLTITLIPTQGYNFKTTI